MKKTLIIILGLFLLSNCSNKEHLQDNQIIGKWKLIEVQYLGIDGLSSKDYSSENIIYNFKSNGILEVTGGENIGYSTGEYDYIFGEGNLGGDNVDPKVLLLQIDGSKWTFDLNNEKLKIGQSYVDGADLIFVRI